LKFSIETIIDNYDNDAIERKFVVLPFKRSKLNRKILEKRISPFAQKTNKKHKIFFTKKLLQVIHAF